MEGPFALTGPRVVSADVARPRDARSDDDGVPDDQRDAAPAVHVVLERRLQRGRVGTFLGVLVVTQIDEAAVSKLVNWLPGFRVCRNQIVVADRQQPFVDAVSPVRDRAARLSDEIGGLDPRSPLRQFLDPDGLAGTGIARLDQANSVGRIDDAVAEERRRLQHVGGVGLRILGHELAGQGGTPPGDAQRPHVLLVDLIERRVLGVRLVTPEHGPFAAPGSLLSSERDFHEQGDAHYSAETDCSHLATPDRSGMNAVCRPTFQGRAACARSADGYFAVGLSVKNLYVWSISVSVGNSEVPAGYSPFCNMNARMSAVCLRLRLPGSSSGMDVRIRSNKSERLLSFQFGVNPLPTSAGACRPPVKSVP